jgi:soluble lytic murein transglycosylase-like protein
MIGQRNMQGSTLQRAFRRLSVSGLAALLLGAAAIAAPSIKVSARAREKAVKGRKYRSALEHYLSALELDPYNAAARAGIDAVTGVSPAARGRSGCPGAESAAASPRARAVLNPFANASTRILGRIPGVPTVSIRREGALYERARPFLGFVLESSERNGVDPRLILAVIRAESNFDPGARSSSGARGLMQLMPGTAKRFGAKSIGDPAQNIEAGTRYLRYLLELFKGDVDRTLGAYIAGEMAVVRSGGVPPTKGVQAYVRKVRNYAFEF